MRGKFTVVDNFSSTDDEHCIKHISVLLEPCPNGKRIGYCLSIYADYFKAALNAMVEKSTSTNKQSKPKTKSPKR